MKRLTTLILFGLIISSLLSACQQQPRTLAMCEQTVRDYADHRDNPNMAEAYGQLFSENGSFTLGEATTKGRLNLIKRHQSAHQATRWNHVMDDITVRSDLTGQSRVIVYTSPKNSSPDNITRLIVADYIDQYEVIASGCKILDRHVNVIYDSAAKP